MVWQKKFYRMQKNNCFALGMALLSLTLVFAACADMSSHSSASQILVIGPAAGPVVQVHSTGTNNSRASYRPDGMMNEVSVAADTTTITSGMAYAADNYSGGRARKAYCWADGERGPPNHERGMI